MKDWLGSDVEEYLEDGNVNPEYVTPSRTAYVRSIMYPSIEVPVTIEKIANDANHSITCHQQTDAFVKWLENDSFGNNEYVLKMMFFSSLRVYCVDNYNLSILCHYT